MRRRRGAFLCFNVDCDAGLEFHGEVVGEDGDFLDELFDQSLIELCDVGFLTGDEVLQLLDSVHDFFPAVPDLVLDVRNRLSKKKQTTEIRAAED